MTATTAPAARFAIVVGTKEVTFTPYVIRKVGEVRSVTIDGVVQSVIYNDRRGLTYLTLGEVTGRIAAELEDGGDYSSVTKSRKAVAPAGKREAAKAEVAAPTEAVAPAPKKVRKAPQAA